MGRLCKFLLVAFSCLVFVMFLAWSVSDPGESRNEVVLVEIEKEQNIVVIPNNEADNINPQAAFRQTANNGHHDVMDNGSVNVNKEDILQVVDQDTIKLQQKVRPETFFSSLNLTFADIKLLKNDSVPTETFIAACMEMGPFLSKLGSGISVIKKEVESNLHDINRKYIQNKESYHTLQAMVLSEIDSGVVMKHHTCSRSLRWIRRMFEFISIFLEKLASGEKDLTKAARVAYDTAISMHHNYFIRKAISTGLHLLPRYNTFLISMSVDPADADKPTFEEIFNEDVLHYISTLKPICNNIRKFYTDHQLEN